MKVSTFFKITEQYRNQINTLGDNNDVPDLFQETMDRILAKKAYKALREDAKIRPWIFQCAYYTMKNILRKQYITPLQAQRLSDVLTKTPEFEQAKNRLLVKELLAQLPEKERTLIINKYLMGYTYDQLGFKYCLPAGTMRQRIVRGFQRLRKQYNKEIRRSVHA